LKNKKFLYILSKLHIKSGYSDNLSSNEDVLRIIYDVLDASSDSCAGHFDNSRVDLSRDTNAFELCISLSWNHKHRRGNNLSAGDPESSVFAYMSAHTFAHIQMHIIYKYCSDSSWSMNTTKKIKLNINFILQKCQYFVYYKFILLFFFLYFSLFKQSTRKFNQL